MNPFSNPLYLLPPLVAVAVNCSLIALVLLKSRRTFADWIFCGFLFSLGLTSLLVFGMRSSPNIEQALAWEKALILAAASSFVLYYHFTHLYTHVAGKKGFLVASYSLLVLASASAPTDLIWRGMRVEYYGYAPIAGPLGYALFLFVLLLIGGGIYNLAKRYRVCSSHVERNRLLYLMIAALIPLSGALLDAFSNLPPVAIWSYIAFCIICTIGIVRHHLMDICIVVQKGLVYILVSAVVAVPYAGALILLNQILKGKIEQWWVHALIILLLTILLRPLYSRAQDLVDRLFYRDRYDYLRTLEQFSHEAQGVTNLNELASTMVKLISGALRVSSVCLLLSSRDKNGLVVVSSSGLESPPSEVVLRNSSPVVEWLNQHGGILSSEQFDIVPQLQSFSQREMDELQRMAAKLYVPIKTRQGRLSGILILAQKLSKQPYSEEDKQLLMTVSNQMAVALENSQLYTLERNTRQELERQDEQKTEFLHSVAHELKTPLTAIFSSSELLGRELSSTTPSQRQALIRNISRSAWLMDKRVSELLDHARIQVGGLGIKSETLDVDVIIEEVASQLLPIFKNKEQSLKLEIPGSLSPVIGDREKLEQILLNLLSNANKFSPTWGNITLRAREVDARIVVEVEDSAPVITEEVKEKLFNPYYRGDKRQRIPGLGLGLAISKKLVELHRGEIWVEGEPGKGNTFAFSLPTQEQRDQAVPPP